MVVKKEHDHPPNPAQTTTQLAIAGMRKRARDESTSINVICDDQLEVLSQEQNSSKLQVWSYSSATDTPYEGEGEKDTESLFDRFDTGGMTLNEYQAAIKHLTGR